MATKIERELSIPKLMFVAAIVISVVIAITWVIAKQPVDLKPAKIVSLVFQIIAMYFTFDSIRRMSLDVGSKTLFQLALEDLYNWIFPVKSQSFSDCLGKGSYDIGDINCSMQSFVFAGKDADINKRFEQIQDEIVRNSTEVQKLKTDLTQFKQSFIDSDEFHKLRFEKLESQLKETEIIKNKRAVKDGCKVLILMFISAFLSVF